MANPSSVASGKNSPKAKQQKPAPDLSKIEEIRNITYGLLQLFPVLKAGPDVMYYLMATWGAESGWKLLHNKNNPSSRHWTPSPPDKSSITRVYQNSNVVKNVYNSPSVTPQIRTAVEDGWYPHGITATMGSYMVRGNPNNLQEWRARPEAIPVIEQFGLEVDAGVSITQTLFPVDNVTCRTRSIASGIIIFNSKYCAGLRKYSNNTTKAMQYALMAYLGSAGVADLNGVTPEIRAADLNSASGRSAILAQIDVVRTGSLTTLTDEQKKLSSIYNKTAREGGSNQVANNTAAPATTDSGANGKSAKIPGCEV